MKAWIFALLLFGGLGASAQIINYAMEVVPLSVDEVEKSTTWNLSGRSVVRDDGRAYVFVDEGFIYESFGGSCRAYALVGDSLFFRGYNVGRHERMNVTEGEGFVLAPQDAGQTATYVAEGRNRDNVRTAEAGSVTYTVLGPGRIVMGLDTIRNVSLNRMEFDAVKSVGDSALTTGRKFVVYNWTVPSSPYPIAVQFAGEGEPVLYLRPLDGEEMLAEEDSEVLPDDEAVMRVLDGATVSTGSGTLTLTFPEGCEAFDVDIYMLDAPGFLYAHKEVNTADGFPCVFETADLKHGQYIVAVNLRDNPALNRKILVVL